MDKVASYKEVIYKQAGALGSVDYSKAKTINMNPSEYVVRDANFREKAAVGASKALKSGKKGIKAMASTPTGKLALATTAAIPVAGIALEKKLDKQREKDSTRNAARDNLNADLARKMKSFPVAGVSAAASVGALALASKKSTQKYKDILSAQGEYGLKNAKKYSDRIMRAGAAMGGASLIAGGMAKNKLEKDMAMKKLDKESEKYLGRKATDKERATVNNFYKTKANLKVGQRTPESEVQKIRRQRNKNK